MQTEGPATAILESHLELALKAFDLYTANPSAQNAVFAHGVYGAFGDSLALAADTPFIMDLKPKDPQAAHLNDYLLEFAIGGGYLLAQKNRLSGEPRSSNQSTSSKSDLMDAIDGRNNFNYSQMQGIVLLLVHAQQENDVLEVLNSVREQHQENRSAP